MVPGLAGSAVMREPLLKRSSVADWRVRRGNFVEHGKEVINAEDAESAEAAEGMEGG